MNQGNKLKRKKKNHGPGNPSKRHRDRLNAELDNLARLLPFPEETVTKLDKISILRLTVSYLRAKSFFQVNGKNGQEESCEDLVREFEGNGLFSQLSLEALDGFIVVITQDGQLFYVSENVREFLGYSQAAVIHQSIYKFLHIDDQDMVKLKLAWPNNVSKEAAKNESEMRRRDSVSHKQENGKVAESSELEKLNRSFTCRMKCTLNHGGGFYKLFKLSGRLREIQTRKRDGDVVEYGLFAICSPAHNPNGSSSASSVKKEVAITAQKRIERTISDPLGARRNAYPPQAMMRPSHIGTFLYPDARAPFSPLASPTASSDSEHPSPASSQTGRTGSMEQESRSDISEHSSSSRTSLDNEMRERLMAANKARMVSYRFDRKGRAMNFGEVSQGEDIESSARKRSRSVADTSELRPNDYEVMRNGRPFGIGAGTSLPSIAEIKTEEKSEAGAGTEASRAKAEAVTRRPPNSYDNRLDAARGLVNLAGMPIPYAGLYPFPEFMYPDVMFPRLDPMHSPLDVSHMRNPFDPHNPCYVGNDPCNQMAMRRWLSTSDLYRAQMNPMLAAQTSLMSPVERMRYLQFPFPYGGFPYPGHMPFDMASGLSERNLPEFIAKRKEGENSEPQTPTVKELPAEDADADVVVDPTSSPKSDTSRESIVVKMEKIEGRSSCPTEKPSSPRKVPDDEERITNGLKKIGEQPSGDGERREENVNHFRVNLTGIQAEFASRLENLNKSFSQSFAGDVKKQDK